MPNGENPIPQSLSLTFVMSAKENISLVKSIQDERPKILLARGPAAQWPEHPT